MQIEKVSSYDESSEAIFRFKLNQRMGASGVNEVTLRYEKFRKIVVCFGRKKQLGTVTSFKYLGAIV